MAQYVRFPSSTATYTVSQPACEYCGCIHSGICPRIKFINYYKDGQVKSVGLHQPQPPADYPAKICIKCGGMALFPTVLPYTSKWNGEILCGKCMSDLVDEAIDEANETLAGGE